MLQRGRKSSEVGSNVVGFQLIEKKPLETNELTDADELKIWHEVINDNPPDYFSVTHRPLLEMYCRQIVEVRKIEKMLARVDIAVVMANGEAMRIYRDLIAVKNTLSKDIQSLATKLRITKQSVCEKVAAISVANHRAKSATKPWEDLDS